MSAADRAKFANYCGMTCLGGSEKRQCSCRRPSECEMRSHPYYGVARDEARARMVRFLKNAVERINQHGEG